MPTRLCDLPEEVITIICQYIPEAVASMALTCTELHALTRRAFVKFYVRCPQIVVETDNIAIRCLEVLKEADNRFFLDNIHELAIHSYVVSAIGSVDEIGDIAAIADSVDRINMGLYKVLPRLRNCRKIKFSWDQPVGSDGESFNFFGLHAFKQHRNNSIYEPDPMQKAILPYRFMCENQWGIISAVAQTSNNVEELHLEPITLRDVYSALRQQPCAEFACLSVKKLVLELYDVLLDTYRIDFREEPASSVAFNGPPAVANGQNGHSCQSLCRRNKYESSHVDIDRSIVQSLFRHFPNLEVLDYQLHQEWLHDASPLFDGIPSYLPVSLREMKIKCWTGYGIDLAATLLSLPRLQKLVLVRPSVGSMNAFRDVIGACREHPSLSSLRIIGGTVGIPTLQNTGVTNLCLGTCQGKWCKIFVRENSSLDESTPLMGVKDTLRAWQRNAHGIQHALTFDVEDMSDAFAILFHNKASE